MSEREGEMMELNNLHKWVLRGLVMSCITACQMWKWLNEYVYAYRGDVDQAIEELRVEGLVEVQRTGVECRVCGRLEAGYAMTARGCEVQAENEPER